MITSSSNRIIKRPDAAGLVTRFIPLSEVYTAEEPVVKKAMFPHLTLEGKEKKEEKKEPSQEELFQEQEQGESDKALEEEAASAEEEALSRQWKQEAQEALEEAKKTAREIIEQARAQAEEELAAAKEEGYRTGYGKGYREGMARGEAECREMYKEKLTAFDHDMRRALGSVETAKENCLRRYLDELKDCAIAIGEKVIHISLRSSGEVIKKMIVSATEKLKKTAWVKIYIDKCDYDMMMETDADILDELSHLSDNIKFIVMDKEERGNCIIEMPEEIVDVSVNTQMENIKDILENVRI